MKKILILNGPNLNMLGQREPEIYGTQTLADIETLCEDKAKTLDFKIDFRQSNHEGEFIEWIHHSLREGFDGLVINAGAWTHTSIAIHDALKLLKIPVIEVHISDPKKREPFRHVSYIEPVAASVIAGKGVEGYALAIEALDKLLTS